MVPKVSVILPVYNSEAYLNKSITSALSQTLIELEVICINDGSLDSSGKILDSLRKTDDRIKILTQDNQGSGYARNNGMAIARGEYIAFLDADDWYPNQNTLETLYCLAKKHNVSICGGSLLKYRNDNFIDELGDNESGLKFEQDGIMNYVDYQEDYGYQRFIYNRAFIEENRICFQDYKRWQDPPFFVKAMCISGKFYAIKQATYCYRAGHQNYDLSERQIIDALTGIADNLIISKHYCLPRLHAKTVRHVLKSIYQNAVLKYLLSGSDTVLNRLIAVNAQIETALAREGGLDIDDGYLLKPFEDMLIDFSRNTNKRFIEPHDLEKVESELWKVKRSFSYRIGRLLTFIPRKFIGIIKCIKDHGLLYTLKYVTRKLFYKVNIIEIADKRRED